MAYQEIPDDPIPEAAEYFKFVAINDRFAGWYVSQREGKYGPDYTFRRADGANVTITASGQLKQKLTKADLQPGAAILITYTGTKDIGGTYPMKLYRVAMDPAPATKMPPFKAPAAKAPKPAAPEPTPEDIPF